MKKVFSCPSCGADIAFKSIFSMYNTCSYCKSVVVKHGVDLEAIGTTSEFPQDLTPLQIGTIGYYKKARFEIVGRQKVRYERGFWNEWYICFENGQDGWLADAQGFYLFSTELNTSQWTAPFEDKIKVGQKIEFNNIPYIVDDIKTVTQTTFSGELPWYNSQNPKKKSIDLSNHLNCFANIEYYDENVKVYIGEYKEFDEFQFENLRVVDGW